MTLLNILEAKELLAKGGISVLPSHIVEDFTDACSKALEFSYPVVLKLVSSRYTHKSDIGGVKTGIGSESSLKEAFAELEALRECIDPDARVIIEPMASPGIELFVGFIRDPQFGPVLSFGLGGVLIELLEEISFVLLPALESDFLRMFRKIRGWNKIRQGFRNFPPVNEEKLTDFLQHFARWVLEQQAVVEVDLNPIIIGSTGIFVVDARIGLKE